MLSRPLATPSRASEPMGRESMLGSPLRRTGLPTRRGRPGRVGRPLLLTSCRHVTRFHDRPSRAARRAAACREGTSWRMLMAQEFSTAVLQRLPLAQAILALWRFVGDPAVL